nr:MAG TPA: hypothetical protein [Caudoviricetes sp.]
MRFIVLLKRYCIGLQNNIDFYEYMVIHVLFFYYMVYNRGVCIFVFFD